MNFEMCFNPCCNGMFSKVDENRIPLTANLKVLILVVMECFRKKKNANNYFS